MAIQIPLRMPAFMRIELTVDGRPELDRVIHMPSRAPLDWISEAYCLSLGLDPAEPLDDDGFESCHHDSPYAYPWPALPPLTDMPPLPHDPRIVVTPTDSPGPGRPWLTVSRPDHADEGTADAARSGSWLTAAAPFDEDAVNRELLRAHGIVQPYFDDGDHWWVDPRIPDGSPLASLALAVSPARRLALLAHVDRLELNGTASPDYTEAESALTPLIRLMEIIGDAGVAQHPMTGWLEEAAVHRLSEALEWGTAEEASARAEQVVSLARAARFIRRFKGRVVSTSLGRRMIVLSPHTLDFLARLVMEPVDDRSSYRPLEEDADSAAALLAIADGTVQRLDDLPDSVLESRRAFADSGVRFDTLGQRVASVERVSPVVEEVRVRLASLSAAGEFGTVSSAMREVARLALVGGSRDRYAW